MDGKRCEAVIVGAAITDLQIYPVGREIVDAVSYPVEQMVWTVGGDALNEATILTRLGHTVRLVSCIGEDAPGEMIAEHCRRNGIDTAWLKRDGAKTTAINVGLIWKDGERTFLNNRAGSIWTVGPEDIDLSAVADGSILSFASIFNNPRLDGAFLVELFRRARAHGMCICADMVSRRCGETLADIAPALSYVDYFLPNYTEARELTGCDGEDEIADRLLACGVGTVVLKTGKRGCLVKSRSERFEVPAHPRTNCIDTTGAGDNFASGFLCGLLEGRTLRQCAELANCTASIAVESVGATTGVQDRAQVDRRCEEYRRLF